MKDAYSQSLVITCADLVRLYKRYKTVLKKTAWICGTLCLFCLIVQPPQYLAIGLFKHADQQVDLSTSASFRGLIKNITPLDLRNSPVPIFRSQTTMRDVVQTLGLQVIRLPSSFALKCCSFFCNNVLSEIGLIPSAEELFSFRNVVYDGAVPLFFDLVFRTKDRFDVFDLSGHIIASGNVGDLVTWKGVEWILESVPHSSLALEVPISFTLRPWTEAVNQLLKRVQIKSSKLDPSFFHISCWHFHPILAAAIVNQIMYSFRDFLKRGNDEIIREQILSLENRKKELVANLDNILQQHTDLMKTCMVDGGCSPLFDSVDKTHLFGEKEYIARLLNVKIALEQFNNTRILQQKKKKDLLLVENFQTREIFSQLTLPYKKMEIIAHPRQIILKPKKALLHFFDTEKSESLGNMGSHVVQKLYCDHSQKLDQIRILIRQLLLVRQKMEEGITKLASEAQQNSEGIGSFAIPSEDHSFEWSLLSGILSDPVGLSLLKKGEEIISCLRHPENYSVRELHRLKEALRVHQLSLAEHIEQLIFLHRVEVESLEEKQEALCKEHRALLQKEKMCLEEQLREMRKKIIHLPENWKLQTQLKWQQDVGIAMLREVINLVESKILHCRMYYIESKPIDLSLPPLHPLRSYFLFYSLGGACLGFCLVYGWLVLRQCYRGFPASFQMLQKERQHILGMLSPKSYVLSHTYPALQEWDKKDRETLQNIFFFLKDRTGTDRSRMPIVLLLGSSLSLTLRLSELSLMCGQRILLVDCRSSSDFGVEKGLRDYLLGEVQDLPIFSKQGMDIVLGGGICRYGYEQIIHDKGLDPLHRLDRYLAQYDMLMLFDDFPYHSFQVHPMLGVADKVVCVVKEERLEDLVIYFNEKKTTFVTVEA